MALRNIQMKMGVAKDDTDYSLNGYAIDSQWIRISNGNVLPQGGYALKNSLAMSGVARGIFSYATSDGSLYCAIGTHKRLYIQSSSYIQNITPTGSSGTLGTDPFSTVSTSNVVTVTHTAHGLKDGAWVYLGNASTFNGLTIGGSSGNLPLDPFTTSIGSPVVQVTHIGHGMASNDEVNFTGSTTLNGVTISGVYLIRVLSANTYQIYCAAVATSSGSGGGTPAYNYRRAYQASFVDANTYTITDVATATGTGTGGGSSVQYLYELAAGLQNGVSGTGYSAGGYSVGPYSVSFAGSTITFNPRTWSFAPYGDTLIACPSGGTIYEWTQNWSQRAVGVTNAPAKVLYVAVTAQRQILACGTTTLSSTFDPMQIRWCDVSDRTVWTPANSNNAGNLKLAKGANIVCASSGDSGTLVWTDSGFYNVTYIGDAGGAYRADLIAPNFGICGPNAYLDLGLEVYWVTPRGSFARYRGGVPEELECRSKKWFNGKAIGQNYKIFAFYDQRYPAVSWLFQMGSSDCDTYIRFDMESEVGDGAAGWSVGTVDRTAWIDSPITPYPLAVSSGGLLYEQENGNSANGNPLTRSIEFREVLAWDDQFGQSDRVVNVNKIVPSVQVQSGSLGVFFDFRRYPNGPIVTKPTTGTPFAITSTTQYLSMRGQGRSMSIRLISNSTNDNWTCGGQWKADASAGARR